MNISSSNVTGTCNNKCSYSYDYPTNSTTTASNYGQSLSVSCTQTANSATYNNTQYEVTNLYLFSPSLHQYNNSNAAGELIIIHTPTQGGNSFYVCIPLTTNGTSNTASTTISEIIAAVKSGAPSQGESVSQGISEFTLNDFIPSTTYFNYSTESYDAVAFGIQQAIYISQENLTSLQQCITTASSSILSSSGSELFSSTSSPIKGSGTSGSDIYIDCQPTNESAEEINQVSSKPGSASTISGFNMSSLTSNPTFISVILFLISAAIFFIFIMGFRTLMNYLGGDSGSTTVVSSAKAAVSKMKLPNIKMPHVKMPTIKLPQRS
jgi:carbonic anhydrase